MSYASQFAYIAGGDRDARVPADLNAFVVQIETAGPARIVANEDGTAPLIRRLPGRVFFSDTSVAIFGPHGVWYSIVPPPRRSAF